ncbi:hypothetical protein [Flavobacterium sp.]|uniref:hypothetical protein n=1 Tax=Flavobacterium sp. TaxID=239 RepID=UPI002B4B40EE|nr:hypothetical protein [Flavobacterium sp.]HLP64929.1 hypothetical protein [Flavobacterium sp.]
MNRIASLLVVFLLISCSDKEEMLLPKADVTIVKEVYDHSPIYLFFRVKGKDTVAELNRKNAIGTSNWIFNIDKRLPLKAVIPHLQFMKEKRKKGMHTNEKAEDYFSYADSIGKNLAFLPFTKVEYHLEKPEYGFLIFFSKNNTILVLNSTEKEKEFSKPELLKYLLGLESDKPNKFFFCHDQNCSYEQFLQNSIFITQFKLQLPVYNVTNEEFVF